MMPKCSIKVFTHCAHPSDSLRTPLHLMDYMQLDPGLCGYRLRFKIEVH